MSQNERIKELPIAVKGQNEIFEAFNPVKHTRAVTDFADVHVPGYGGTCVSTLIQTCRLQRNQLQLSYASMDWQFRVSHSGLFLPFGIIFLFYSMAFMDVIYLVVICDAIEQRYGTEPNLSDANLFSSW
jgi:hypothetical protein